MTNRSGRWNQQIVFKNCGKEYCQQGCALNNETKPHGPYVQLRRRNPDEAGQQDTVYLGKVPLTDDQLDIINRLFLSGHVPTREEVLSTLRRERKAEIEAI